MKRKLIFSIFLFIAICFFSKGAVNAVENVLLITSDDIVNGATIKTMMEEMSNNGLNVTQMSIGTNKTLEGLSASITVPSEPYRYVIIQDSYSNHMNATTNYGSIIKGLHVSLGSPTSTDYYFSTPWGDLTDTAKEEVLDKCEKVIDDTAGYVPSISIINVYEKLIEASNKSLTVVSSNKLTTEGELLISGLLCSSTTGRSLTNLGTYAGVSDEDMTTIVEIINNVSNGIGSNEPEQELGDEPASEADAEPAEEQEEEPTASTTTVKTTKTTEMGNLTGDPMGFEYLAFKSDREPRLSFISTASDYVYIKIKDCNGIRSTLLDEKYEKYEPKVYLGKKKDESKEIQDLRRPSKSQYVKEGKEWVYTVGIPTEYVKKRTDFYIIAYDTGPYGNLIKEHFALTPKSDGTYDVDRAPRAIAVTTSKDMKSIAFYAVDYSGIGKIFARTKKKDSLYDSLGDDGSRTNGWKGTIQEHWSQVAQVTNDRKNVVQAITTTQKVKNFFKSSKWKGKDPAVKDKSGVYHFVVEATDKSGMKSVKTMTIDTNYYVSGNSHTPIDGKTSKTTTTKKTTTTEEENPEPESTTKKTTKTEKTTTKTTKQEKTTTKKTTTTTTKKTTKTTTKKTTKQPSNNYMKFGSALAVMHADDYGNLDRVRQAATKKYYAIEGDYRYKNGVMWCYHDGKNSKTGTLQQNMQICKSGGAKLLIDLKSESTSALKALGDYIRNNNLQNWVIVQTNDQAIMKYLNNVTGSKLEYWGLVMSSSSTISQLKSKASSNKALGMTTVNIPKVAGKTYVLGTKSNISALRNAGYDICVFTWTSFSSSEVSNYTSYGAKYLMTNNINQK